MNPSRTRRATTDDLAQLQALWEAARFPVGELEKRFTEFQVVEDEAGNLAAAIGLQICGSEGHIHSETFADFGLTDRLRPGLWERLQVVARNNGLFRVWTRETAPFWRKDAGFSEATAEARSRLPESFGEATPGWLVLRLRDEGADPVALDAQFQIFKGAEDAKRERIYSGARMLLIVAYGIAIALFAGGVILLLYFLRHRRR